MILYLRNNSAVFLSAGVLLVAIATTIALLLFQERRIEIRNTNRIAEARAFLDRRIDQAATRTEAAEAALRLDAIEGALARQRDAASATALTAEQRFAKLNTRIDDLKTTSVKEVGCDVLIEALPLTIKSPGVYCLARSIDNSAVELDAINILSNDVVIDGRGYLIAGPAVPGTKTRGVLAVDKRGLTIRNLRIEGFSVAILIGDTTTQIDGTTAFPSDRKSRDIVIDGVRSDNATFQGIHVRADNFTIRNSSVAGIGPSTVNPHSFATGILTRGNNCTIAHNRVALGDAIGNGENIGIALNFGSGCEITDNVVYFDKYPQWGRNFGIWTKAEGGSLPKVTGNLVAGAHYAYGPQGIFLDNMSENVACNLFARRASSADLLADVRGNIDFNSGGFVRPGSIECPDDPAKAISRFEKLPSAEAAYAVALAYAEVSPVEKEVDTLAWLIVSSAFSHPLGKVVDENPAASGYKENTVQSAREMATRILAKVTPPPG